MRYDDMEEIHKKVVFRVMQGFSRYTRLLALFAALLLPPCVAHAEFSQEERAVAARGSGIYYFADIGIPAETLLVSADFYIAQDDIMSSIHTRQLDPSEVKALPAPEGLIALQIHLDEAKDRTATPAGGFDQIEFSFSTVGAPFGGKSRALRAVATGYQYLPEKLYLYKAETEGVVEDSIFSVVSNLRNPFRDSWYAYAQVTQANEIIGRQTGMDDNTPFYLIGEDVVRFSFSIWDKTKAGRIWQGYELEASLASLDLGESITLPLNANAKESSETTVTVTKVALLRDGDQFTGSTGTPASVANGLPDPINWPEDSVGRIVVLESGTNVREGGSTNYKVLTRVRKGDVFYVVGADASGWYAFYLPEDGQLAYIHPSKVEFTPRR